MASGAVSLLIRHKVPVGFSPNGFAAIVYRGLDLVLHKRMEKARMWETPQHKNAVSSANTCQGKRGGGTCRVNEFRGDRQADAVWRRHPAA